MFAEQLQKLLDTAQTSKADLARLLKVSPPAVSHYLSCENLQEGTINKIAFVLGYSVRLEFGDLESD